MKKMKRDENIYAKSLDNKKKRPEIPIVFNNIFLEFIDSSIDKVHQDLE
jgi:hypothetical protein